jgi:hypothetical protein
MRLPFSRRAILILTMCAAYLTGATAWAAARASAQSPSSPASQSAPETVQGKLVIGPQGALHVQTATGEVVVTSTDSSILHTLQDPRMNGREVRLEGKAADSPAKSLDVAHVFTIHDGKLFRLRFYCHVCNIPATEPGPCVCCQRWTDLEEIPVSQVTDDMVLVP